MPAGSSCPQVIDSEPFKCRSAKDCQMAAEMKARASDLILIRDALSLIKNKSENSRRLSTIRDLVLSRAFSPNLCAGLISAQHLDACRLIDGGEPRGKHTQVHQSPRTDCRRKRLRWYHARFDWFSTMHHNQRTKRKATAS